MLGDSCAHSFLIQISNPICIFSTFAQKLMVPKKRKLNSGLNPSKTMGFLDFIGFGDKS